MIEELLSSYGYFAIIVITFLEGESVVILAGMAASMGMMDLPLVIAAAVGGSFCGDQLYYSIGRRFGAPMLDRWPGLKGKTAWAFKLVRNYETPFILSFRFIYGVRNISPFVIGMAGIPRLRFMALNFVAATLWALAFSFGGFYFGRALESLVGEHKVVVLGVLAAVAVVFGIWHGLRKRRKMRQTAPADSPAVDREAA